MIVQIKTTVSNITLHMHMRNLFQSKAAYSRSDTTYTSACLNPVVWCWYCPCSYQWNSIIHHFLGISHITSVTTQLLVVTYVSTFYSIFLVHCWFRPSHQVSESLEFLLLLLGTRQIYRHISRASGYLFQQKTGWNSWKSDFEMDIYCVCVCVRVDYQQSPPPTLLCIIVKLWSNPFLCYRIRAD